MRGMALPGNPFDGHTLVDALAQVRRLTICAIDEASSIVATGGLLRKRQWFTSLARGAASRHSD